MTIFLGETFRVQAVITDFDDSELSPDSHSITIYDPDGELQLTDTSPSGSAGTYTIDFTTEVDDEDGIWTVIWESTVNSTIGYEIYQFRIISRPY